MRALKIGFLTFAVIAFTGCGPSFEEKMRLEEQALLRDSIAGPLSDTLLQLHYSMNATFEVENALHTTLLLEHLCKNADGYIESSKTDKNCISSNTVQIAKDTSQVISTYNYNTVLHLQVPVKNVNGFIDSVAGFASNLLTREISGKNLAANFAATKTSANELGSNYKDFQSDYPSSAATKNNAQQQLETKLSYLATKSQNSSELTQLQLQKSYASITLCFSDKEKIKQEKFALPILPQAYGSDFGSESISAISIGTALLKNLCLLLLKIWPLILVVLFFSRRHLKHLVEQTWSRNTFQNSNHK